MKVLQIGTDWFPERPGGLARMFYGGMRFLPGAGVTVRGLAIAQRPDLEVPNLSIFAPPEVSLGRRWWGLGRSVSQILSSESIDLVASHFALYTLPILPLLSRTPLVVHFHGPWALESQAEGASGGVIALKRWLEGQVYRRARGLIVLSEAFRSVLHEGYGVPTERIHVVPGGVDVSRFVPAVSPLQARRQLGWPEDRYCLLSVRRLTQRMGLESLIRAIALLRPTLPLIRLYIAGTGPQRSVLEALTQELDLQDHVRLLGFVPDADLPLVYRAAHLSVMPSLAWEGFGLSVVESLAVGTPVLVTAVGGMPEIIRPLSPQLIVPDSEPETLARAIAQIYQGTCPLPEPATCETYVRNHYDWSVIAAQWRDIYRLYLTP
ncbi:MAG: glycosyltransferase family 4 protein [Oscillatoriales cyanobacterium SM2_2_1]|nr:glycosyltransferase family 4 protein [Oscillatoriales cyanobacterium SM2_2_1]